MQKTRLKRMLSLAVCTVLIAAMALFAAGCSDKKEGTASSSSSEVSETEITVVGEGETEFMFSVIDTDGEEVFFEIHTDEDIVGKALTEIGMIEGEDGPYGLYVKTVNGTTLDYDKDGKYWAFYVDGEYAVTGVDITEIETEKAYSFRAEK